jgi:hypothetical protein
MNNAFRLTTLAILVAAISITIVISCKEKRPTETHQKTAEYHYIRDYQYEQDRIYDLGQGYDFNRGDLVTSLKVFVGSEDPYEDTLAIYSILSLNPLASTCPVWCEIGTPVRELEVEHYELMNDSAANQHILIFDSARALSALGVWMIVRRDRMNGAEHAIDTIGRLTTFPDTLLLKMLKPSAGFIPSHPCWNLMHRNVYTIPRGEVLSDIDIKVFRGDAGTEETSNATEFQDVSHADSVRFVRILGLDQYDAADHKLPDNQIDDHVAIFRSDWGLLMFPSWRPFNLDTNFIDDGGHVTVPLTVKAPLIYDYNDFSQPASGSRYFIRYTIWK